MGTVLGCALCAVQREGLCPNTHVIRQQARVSMSDGRRNRFCMASPSPLRPRGGLPVALPISRPRGHRHRGLGSQILAPRRSASAGRICSRIALSRLGALLGAAAPPQRHPWRSMGALVRDSPPPGLPLRSGSAPGALLPFPCRAATETATQLNQFRRQAGHGVRRPTLVVFSQHGPLPNQECRVWQARERAPSSAAQRSAAAAGTAPVREGPTITITRARTCARSRAGVCNEGQ